MILIVMGVVGAGKTTVGHLLADQLGWQFADADDFHPQANIDKIRRGIPLDDGDREPWLQRLRSELINWNSQHINVVLACSALKLAYRQELRAVPDTRFVYLKGAMELIAQRLRQRHGHFANEQILASQFSDLEEPDDAITIDISRSPEQIVADIRSAVGLA